MALPDLTGQNIQDTYQRVLQVGEDGQVFDGTGSLVPTLKMTASHAVTETSFETSSSHAETADTASYILASNIDQPFTNITASGNISSSGGLNIKNSAVLKSHVYIGEHLGERSLYIDKFSNAYPYAHIFAGSVDNNTQVGIKLVTRNSAGTALDGLVIEGSSREATFANVVNCTALNTGQGDNELYDMDQNVLTTSDVVFGSVSSSGIIIGNRLHTDDYIVGDTSVATGLSVNGYIETTNGNITAAGNISASGTLTLGDGTNLLGGKRFITSTSNYEFRDGSVTAMGGILTGNITASGHISASGIIISSNILSLTTTTGSLLNSIDAISVTTASLLNSVDVISVTTASLLNSIDVISVTTGSLLNSVNAISIVTGSYAITGSDVTFGDITASGNISASGIVTAEYVELPPGGAIRPTANNNTISFRAASHTSGEWMEIGSDIFKVYMNGGASDINLSPTGLTLNNANSNQDVRINYQNGDAAFISDAASHYTRMAGPVVISRSGSGATNPLGSGFSAVTDGNSALQLSGSLYLHGLTSHITASGNISASGNVTADQVHTDLIQSTGTTANLYTDASFDTLTIGYHANLNSKLKINSHITASGDISASGEIYSANEESFQFSFMTDVLTTNWHGANRQGLNYYYWNKDYGNDNGVREINLAGANKRFMQSGWQVPYKCQITGWELLSSGNKSNAPYTYTASLFTGDPISASLALHQTNANDVGQLLNLTEMHQSASLPTSLHDQYGSRYINAKGAMSYSLDAGQYVYPRVKHTNLDSSATPKASLQGTWTIYYRRIK